MNNNTSVQFDLAKIINDQFAILEPSIDNSQDGEMKLDFSFNSVIDGMYIAIQVRCELLQDEKITVMIESTFIYQIPSKDWALIYKPENKTVILPISSALAMTSMAIGAIRGIFHEKTEKQIGEGIILPSVNLKEIIKEDVKIEPFQNEK